MIADLRRRQEHEGRVNPSWMVTFSDLSTLLLTFFVLLLSMAAVDNRTLKSMFSHFSEASGVRYFREFGEVSRPKEALIRGLHKHLKGALLIKGADDPSQEAVMSQEAKASEDPGNKVVFQEIRNGFKIVFDHQLLFDPGKTGLKEEMKPILQKIAEFIRKSNYQVYIDGHTDNLPIRDTVEFASNEELSLNRAYHLMEYFVTMENASPASICIAGYGSTRPLVSNHSPEGRSRNRRVEIILKSQKYY